jgi:hypothetical protein
MLSGQVKVGKTRKAKMKLKGERTRAGRGRVTRESSENESSGGDVDEDRLATLELRQLMESNGDRKVEPL